MGLFLATLPAFRSEVAITSCDSIHLTRSLPGQLPLRPMIWHAWLGIRMRGRGRYLAYSLAELQFTHPAAMTGYGSLSDNPYGHDSLRDDEDSSSVLIHVTIE